MRGVRSVGVEVVDVRGGAMLIARRAGLMSWRRGGGTVMSALQEGH